MRTTVTATHTFRRRLALALAALAVLAGLLPATGATAQAAAPCAIAAARPDGDDEGDGGDGGDSGDGDGDEGDGDDGDGDGDGDEGDGDGDDSDAEARARRAEARAKEEAKKRRKAERDLAKRQREDAEASGEYKRMYEEEKARGDGLERQIRDGALERAVLAEAAKQKFRNPSMAYNLVKSDLLEQGAVDEDGEVDDKLVERRLKKLGRDEDYLVDKKQPTTEVRGDRDDEGRSGGRRRRRDRDDDGGDDGDYKFNPRGNLASAYAGAGNGDGED